MPWYGDMAHSAGACPIMDVLSADDQEKLSQRLPSVWGRWEAGWDYYRYRFTGISAPRSSAYLSDKLESPEVVHDLRIVLDRGQERKQDLDNLDTPPVCEARVARSGPYARRRHAP